jgi:predicted aminopeptidase
LNNARLAAVGTYERWVPAFLRLLSDQGGDFEAFYRAAQALGDLDAQSRARRLDALGRAGGSEDQVTRRNCE